MEDLGKFVKKLNIGAHVQRSVTSARNQRREQFDRVGYVLFTLPATMPALPEPRNWIRRQVQGDPPLSLTQLDQTFRQIAEDPRTRGVILHLRGAAMPMADLQSLRNSILRLREAGRRVIVYGQDFDTMMYYVASAADEIVMQPGANMMTTGMRMETLYLKDSLASIGVEFEAVAISPYKSAADQLTRNDISPESREQLNWLLDSRFEQLINGIAEGRGISADEARAFIDSAPYTDHEAKEAGYVDSVLNEEGFAAYLEVDQKDIITYDEAEKRLFIPWREPTEKHIAMIYIGGTIVNGESERPPVDFPLPILGEERAGDLSVVQRVRQLMGRDDIGAVVLYVDSPGGSASASEAMASALEELAKKVPIVVYMNNVAASGGYYVSTPAKWIVAQPGTITGSIGVIGAKPTTQGVFEKLHATRIEFTRGANATFGSSMAPYTDEQREQAKKSIERIYDQFTGRVADARGMTQEAVDAIGGGRVWTGAQALEHGLVDELGDLRTALNKARELAGLPENTPLAIGSAQKKAALAPQLAELEPATAGLMYAYRGLQTVFNGRAMMLMPFIIDE